MARRYDALYRLGQIDEGRLTEALDAELQDAVQALLKHRKDHGEELTTKAKAEVTLKLTIKASKGEGAYAIVSSFKRVLPGRPDTETFAVAEYDKGQRVLIVQAGGSTADDPRQDKLDFPAPPSKLDETPKRKAE